MVKGIILDTGPLVAFMDRSENHHEWACHQFKLVQPPLLTCEPVLTECLFLLRRHPTAQEKLLDLVARRVLEVEFSLKNEIESVQAMFSQYRNVPMALADSCLVRMAEVTGYPICTLDSDFFIYRKKDGHGIQVITP